MTTQPYNPQDFRNHEVLQVLLSPERLSQDPSLLADLIDPLPNAHQYAMAGCLYFQRHGKFPRKQAQCDAAMRLLKTFQATLLPEVTKMRISSEQLSKEAEEGWKWERVQQYRDRQKPSEMGTVAEIAAKYNISKSEVRRLKAANQLHTLCKEEA